MIPAAASQAAVLRPGTKAITSVGSLNWAGYAVSRSRVTFTAVRATFFVPYLNCAKPPARALSSAWVGLDGFIGRAHSVEQGGIAANCEASGKAAYFGWWETFPRAEVRVALKVTGLRSLTTSAARNSACSANAPMSERQESGSGVHVTQRKSSVKRPLPARIWRSPGWPITAR
jgi:hypothetical protein